MINVKADIYAALVAGCTGTDHTGADVSDEFPKEWKKFPKVTFTEEQNDVYEWTDNEEKSARIGYRIDVWDKTSTSTVAAEVDAVMSALGFYRTMCIDVPVAETYKHKQMRYEAILCVDDDNVYHDNY